MLTQELPPPTTEASEYRGVRTTPRQSNRAISAVGARPRRLRFVLSAAAVVYLATPIVTQIWLAQHRLASAALRQEVSRPGQLTDLDSGALAALAEQWDALGSRPIVLSYHDISLQSTSPYTISPAQLAEQMALLDALHVHTLTAEEFRRYTEGQPVPLRSVMLTFDDGTHGVYRYADQILAQHGFHAVSFIITGFVGTRAPYYMTWKEIQRLDASGRWDFEAHTNLGHKQVAVDDQGTVRSFLSNRAWLAAERRLETVSEQRARIETDLDNCLHELRRRGYGRGELFAYPFSDYGASSNDLEMTEVLGKATTARFSATFSDDLIPHDVGGPYQFNRLSLGRSSTASSLLQNLGQVIELTQHRRERAG
jgi:poly-beta-1,6-N-acetyl-D-glucosamine N-deacetylase